jgi:hypothetical protein
MAFALPEQENDSVEDCLDARCVTRFLSSPDAPPSIASVFSEALMMQALDFIVPTPNCTTDEQGARKARDTSTKWRSGFSASHIIASCRKAREMANHDIDCMAN